MADKDAKKGSDEKKKPDSWTAKDKDLREARELSREEENKQKNKK